MSTQLHHKTILVTGAAKRVGAAIARRLHRAGANLTLHYHASEREAHALQSELNLQRAQSVMLVKADLLETAGLAEIVKTCVERFGSLDALVNNASAFYPTPVGSISAANWDDLVGANLKAPLFLAQAAAPYLKKSAGCIVNITDIHAERPLKNYPVYSIAKAGLTGLTMSPGIDSAVPQLLTLFGGRQTARLIHFVAASGLVIFVIVHLVMVLLSGVWNNLRSMITGWYVIRGRKPS